MITLDVCLEMVLPSLPYDERIKRIAEAGYKSVEFWFHDSTSGQPGDPADYAKDPVRLRQASQSAGVDINNLVVNSSDGSIGGSPVDSADLNKYLERLHEVIAFAKQIDCKMGITCTGNSVASLTRSQMRSNLVKAYSEAAKIAEKENFTLVVEPLNTHVDHAGYYLYTSCEAAEIIREVSSPALKLLYDVYHMQIMEGNVISNIQKNIDIIGHFHSAGVPGRNEHFGCELNYPEIIKRIKSFGYTGRFGLEYAPAMEDHFESLKQVRSYLLG